MVQKKVALTTFVRKLGGAKTKHEETPTIDSRFSNAQDTSSSTTTTLAAAMPTTSVFNHKIEGGIAKHKKRTTKPHFRAPLLLVASDREDRYKKFVQLYTERNGTSSTRARRTLTEEKARHLIENDYVDNQFELISKTPLALQRKQFPGTGTFHSVHYGMADDIVQVIDQENGVYERTRVGGLVRYLHGREEPWPMHSEHVCWTDCHTFTGIPFGVPIKHDEKTDKFYLTGNFCSPNCAKHYIENDVHTSPALRTWRVRMLQDLCNKYFGYAYADTFFPTIEPAYLYTHQANGMSIEEYRANHKKVTVERIPTNLLLITDEVQIITIERRRTKSYEYYKAQNEKKQDEYVSKDHARTQKIQYGQSRITPSNTIPHSQQQTINRRFHGVIDKQTTPAPTLDAHRVARHTVKKGTQTMDQFFLRE